MAGCVAEREAVAQRSVEATRDAEAARTALTQREAAAATAAREAARLTDLRARAKAAVSAAEERIAADKATAAERAAGLAAKLKEQRGLLSLVSELLADVQRGALASRAARLAELPQATAALMEMAAVGDVAGLSKALNSMRMGIARAVHQLADEAAQDKQDAAAADAAAAVELRRLRAEETAAALEAEGGSASARGLSAEATQLRAALKAVEEKETAEARELSRMAAHCLALQKEGEQAAAQRASTLRGLADVRTTAEEKLTTAGQASALAGKQHVTASLELAAQRPHYKLGEWSACSIACGGGGKGRRTRQVYCLDFTGVRLPLSACRRHLPHLADAVVSEEECGTAACMWSVDDWDVCNAACGGGRQSRAVTCTAGDGTPFTGDGCPGAEPADRPPATRDCNMAACEWQLSQWGDCSAPCGAGGTQTRRVICTAPSGLLFDGDGCPGAAARPQQSRKCNDQPCTLRAGEWTACDACSTTTQTRALSCYGSDDSDAQLLDMAACDGLSLPETERDCPLRPACAEPSALDAAGGDDADDDDADDGDDDDDDDGPSSLDMFGEAGDDMSVEEVEATMDKLSAGGLDAVVDGDDDGADDDDGDDHDGSSDDGDDHDE
eukprot:PLAT15566.1.p1 GENE.PLAT15566.1~~PLAT15566.1.p1  ORF type:complete len:684 (-),score=374.40 PLAT15566.1:149-1996(-)